MKYLIPLLSLALTLSLINCAGGQNQPNMSNVKKEMIELSIDTRMISERDHRLVYEPDSNVKRASYTKYIFAQENFESVAGKDWKKKRTIKAKVEVWKMEMSKYIPEDKNMPAPHGGFNITRYMARLVEVIK